MGLSGCLYISLPVWPGLYLGLSGYLSKTLPVWPVLYMGSSYFFFFLLSCAVIIQACTITLQTNTEHRKKQEQSARERALCQLTECF